MGLAKRQLLNGFYIMSGQKAPHISIPIWLLKICSAIGTIMKPFLGQPITAPNFASNASKKRSVSFFRLFSPRRIR